MDQYGTSKCHYHDSIYHLGTDCSLQPCYTNDTVSPTFDNQLIIEGEVRTKQLFIDQYSLADHGFQNVNEPHRNTSTK